MLPLNPVTRTLPELIQQYRTLTTHGLGVDDYLRLIHTFHSVVIDGCSLDMIEMGVLLDKGLTAGGRSLADHSMAVDYTKAFDEVLTMARQREPLNRAALHKLAAIVMQRTGETIRTLTTSIDTRLGDLRTVEIMPTKHSAVDARKLPAALDALLKEINSGIEKAKTIRQVYDLSFRTHYQLLLLQPFGAGNGRVARLLMNYVQHYHALPLSLVHSEGRPAYVTSLQQSRRAGSEQAFLRFMHGQLSDFFRREIEHFTAC